MPKSLTCHGYEVRQFPGYVVFLFNSGTRIVHLDGKPHLPEQIKLWNGDSRGHWEGNTLVVDVSNNNAKARFADFSDDFSDDFGDRLCAGGDRTSRCRLIEVVAHVSFARMGR